MSSNIGGGVSVSASSQSVNATYGYTDLRQTNFATIGDGTITVRTSTSSVAGTTDTAAALEGLNRDESISQYNTKDTGLQGGFTVDTATVELVRDTAALAVQVVDDPLLAGATIIYDGINTASLMYSDASDTTVMLVDEAVKLEQQAEVVVENAGTWIDDHLFTSDEENNPSVGNNSGVDVDKFNTEKMDEKQDSYNLAYGKIGDTDIVVNKNGKDNDNSNYFVDQRTLPDEYSPATACTFSVYYMAGAILSDNIPNTVEDTAEISKDGAVGKGMYVKNPQGILIAANVDDVIVGSATNVNSNNIAKANQNIINTLDNDGLVHVRVTNDPNKEKSHSVLFTSYSTDNSGQVIFKVKDPDGKTPYQHFDPAKNKLFNYSEDENGNTIKKYDKYDREIIRYQPITKKK